MAFTMPTDEDNDEALDDRDDEAERFADDDVAAASFNFCLRTAAALATSTAGLRPILRAAAVAAPALLSTAATAAFIIMVVAVNIKCAESLFDAPDVVETDVQGGVAVPLPPGCCCCCCSCMAT